MSAKDYQICPSLFKAFIAKVSNRNPNLMTDDRREITDAEIMNLIEWRFRRFCEENKTTKMCININGETVIKLNAKGSLLEELKNKQNYANKNIKMSD